MTRFAVDSNVLIAAAQARHPDNPAAASEIESRLANSETMVLPGHVLLETYSVLTRLPPALRLRPLAAFATVSAFASNAEVVGIPAGSFLNLIEGAMTTRVTGGRIYDALIAEAARVSGAEVLLTFNVRHFAGIAGNMSIVEPGASRS